MPSYNPSQAIVELSGTELQTIAVLIRRRQRDSGDPVTVLIGGWAVDVYNQYFGSVDIDLVTDISTQRWLMDHLTTYNGYSSHIRYPSDTVKRLTPHGEIILDFLSWGTQYPFEGHPEVPFTFDILHGNTVLRAIRGTTEMMVPNRSLLVVLKLKAAWDRSYRLVTSRSPDSSWERGKMIKDYADILALIDPKYGGREIDLEILGTHISRAGFLKELILRIPNLDAVRERYQRMTRQEIQKVCEDLISIL